MGRSMKIGGVLLLGLGLGACSPDGNVNFSSEVPVFLDKATEAQVMEHVVSCRGGSENCVVICHVPPGNPDNRHTIRVGAAALNAHLHHGEAANHTVRDYLGDCAGGGSDDSDSDGDSESTDSSGDTGSGDTGSGDTDTGDTGPVDTGTGDTGTGDTGTGDTGSGGSDAPPSDVF